MSQDIQKILKEKVLKTIREKRVEPKRRSYFLFRDALLWVPGIAVTLIGVFAWAGFFFAITHATWDYGPYIYTSTFQLVWHELPKIWILCFAIFSSGIVFTFKRTKRGYRYRASQVIAGSMLISLTCGVLLFSLDTYYRVSVLRVPSESLHRSLWSRPEDGRLAGVVTYSTLQNAEADAGVQLVDDAKVVWNIRGIEREFFEKMPRPLPGEHDSMMSQSADGVFMRFLGTVLTDNTSKDERTFLACVVLPGKMNPVPPWIRIFSRFEPKKSNDYRCAGVLEQVKEKRNRTRFRRMQ